MEYLDYKTSYPKETHEMGLALKAIIESTAKALEDGFQAGQDIPVIITSAIASLASAINGLETLPEEFKEEAVKSSMGVIAPVADGIQELLKSLKK